MNIQLVLLGNVLEKFIFTPTKNTEEQLEVDEHKQYPALAVPRLITGAISSLKGQFPHTLRSQE